MKFLTKTLSLCLLAPALYATTLVTVNGEKITINDINALLKQNAMNKSYSALSQQEQISVINQAIQGKLIKQKALDEGIRKNPVYKEALRHIEEKLIVEVWMKQAFKNIKIKSEEIKKYYKEHQSSYNKDAQIKARHIVVKTKDEAKDIIKLLQEAKGDIQKQFIELAKSKSIGPSASKGGDLGWFKEGKMLDAFWQEAKSLHENEYSSKPIQTKFGFHVIYVDGKQKAYTIPLEQMYKTIEDKLKMEIFQKTIAQKMNELRKEAEITFE